MKTPSKKAAFINVILLFSSFLFAQATFYNPKKSTDLTSERSPTLEGTWTYSYNESTKKMSVKGGTIQNNYSHTTGKFTYRIYLSRIVWTSDNMVWGDVLYAKNVYYVASNSSFSIYDFEPYLPPPRHAPPHRPY